MRVCYRDIHDIRCYRVTIQLVGILLNDYLISEIDYIYVMFHCQLGLMQIRQECSGLTYQLVTLQLGNECQQKYIVHELNDHSGSPHLSSLGFFD